MEISAAVSYGKPPRNAKNNGLVVNVEYRSDGKDKQNGTWRLRAESIKALVVTGIMLPTDGVTRIDSGFDGTEMFYEFKVDRIGRQFRSEGPTRLGDFKGVCREVPCAVQ